MNPLEAIGRILRQERLRQGRSQQEVARVAGIPNSRLSEYENGRKDLRWTSLQQILKALNCPLTRFARQYEHEMGFDPEGGAPGDGTGTLAPLSENDLQTAHALGEEFFRLLRETIQQTLAPRATDTEGETEPQPN